MICIYILAVGCNNPNSVNEESLESVIKTELRILHRDVKDPDDLLIKITVLNKGNRDVMLWPQTMEYPPVFIEIKDSENVVIHNVPPPVPPSDKGTHVILKPGDSLNSSVNGLPVSRSAVQNGTYFIRCNSQLPCGKDGDEKLTLQSDWVSIQIH